MDGFGAGYVAGRRKQQRKHARELAAQRDQIEGKLRAQYGLPPAAAGCGTPAAAVPVARRSARITGCLVRRLALAALLVAVLFVAIFVAFAIGYGVQHHLIYPAPGR